MACVSDRGQVCLFAIKIGQSVVRSLKVSEIKSRMVQMLFTNRKAWLVTQSECPDLHHVKDQLQQGTCPTRKETSATNVKRYLNKVAIANDGLLVVRKSAPLCLTREVVVVPLQVVLGLMTALHIRLEHPTSSELYTITDRSVFALGLSKIIDKVSKGCHTFASLAKIPRSLVT